MQHMYKNMNLFVKYKYFCILKLSAEVKSRIKVHNKRSLSTVSMCPG